MSTMMKRIIAFFVLIALFIIPVSVFADIPIPDPPYGAYDYWVVVQRTVSGSNLIQLFTSTEPIKVSLNGEQIYYGPHKYYNLVDGHWSYEYESYSNGHAAFNHMYVANHDIAYLDGSGFFFTLPKASALFQALKIMDFGTILRTFSAGLIPLVGLIVLVICFRKGWGFLRNQLMH